MRLFVLLAAAVLSLFFFDAVAFALPTPTVETQKFNPAGNGHYTEFGRAVALSHSTAIITAPQWRIGDPSYGRAFVYERSSGLGQWNLTTELNPEDAAVDQHFGASVDIENDLAVVGAWGDGTNGFYSGAAYVFERRPTGEWSQVAKLLASDGAIVDYFGSGVAISGDQIVVGAHGNSAAYIFSRDSLGLWSQTAKLTSSNPTFDDGFGAILDIEADHVVIGAPFHDHGSAYVFEKQLDGTWSETATLFGNNPGHLDQFGYSVSIDGGVIAVGAPTTSVGNDYIGSVHLFESNELGHWELVQRIDSAPTTQIDRFGTSVSIAANHLLIGASNQNLVSNWYGAAYLYANVGGGPWTLEQVMVGTDSVNGEFGNAVAVDESAAFVGAWRVDFESGLAYSYDLLSVPEPSTLLLVIASLANCLLRSRHRRCGVIRKGN